MSLNLRIDHGNLKFILTIDRALIPPITHCIFRWASRRLCKASAML